MGSREEIVAAAASVMREQGYAHATTKAIAQAAGYSEALLYKHFRDKAALFLAVLKRNCPTSPPRRRGSPKHPGRRNSGTTSPS